MTNSNTPKNDGETEGKEDQLEQGGQPEGVVADGDGVVDQSIERTSLDAAAATDVGEAGEEKKYPLDILKGVQVLVIDDDLSIRKAFVRIIAHYCGKENVSSLAVSSGLTKDVLLKEINTLPDGSLVVLDFSMAGLNGGEAARAIYDARGDSIAVLMVSGGIGGSTSDEFQRRIAPLLKAQEGEDSPVLAGFLQKPVSATVLPQSLANVRGEWLEKNRKEPEGGTEG